MEEEEFDSIQYPEDEEELDIDFDLSDEPDPEDWDGKPGYDSAL